MAMVAELDRKTGRVIKSFRLGQTLTPGDFEAIAMVGPRLFLVTSAGILYEAREGRDGSAVPFTRTPTGASGLCEVEGMSYDPAAQALLLLCKTVTRKKLRGGVLVLRWSLDQNRWLTPDRISVPLDAAFLQEFPGEFRGSDLARDPRTGHYLAVAGINRVVVEFSVEGRLIGQGPLGKHHPQAEGAAIGNDGTIYISDEGAKSPGTVAVYACAK